MILNEKETELVLRDFPKNIKLSYENIVHKKVYNANFYMAIPEGKKCFSWFSTYKNQNVCFIMELTENKKIKNIKIMNVCFNSILSYGTIFYGTCFYHNKNTFFSIEDIFYYKGNNIQDIRFVNKLYTLKNIFENDIKQEAYNDMFIVFGLPIINTNYQDLLNNISMLQYNIKFIQYNYFNNIKNEVYYLNYIKPNTHNLYSKTNSQNYLRREAVFKINAEVQNDIYNLFVYDNGNINNFYDIAYISDYKTSVMMNKLFRNIKENQNLDLLEESDDEEEFENISIDKFVNLNKNINMLCVYNNKFKKWQPLKIADKNNRVISMKELQQLEKK